MQQQSQNVIGTGVGIQQYLLQWVTFRNVAQGTLDADIDVYGAARSRARRGKGATGCNAVASKQMM